jgi:hypothetical protein
MKALIQSKINEVEARIKQFKDSDLFSTKEKEEQIDKLELQLAKLLLEFAKEIEVNQEKKL